MPSFTLRVPRTDQLLAEEAEDTRLSQIVLLVMLVETLDKDIHLHRVALVPLPRVLDMSPLFQPG
jgi:hypothetical protein